MIQISGIPFKQNEKWQLGSIEKTIIQQMQSAPVFYSYYSEDELLFELKLRKNIIQSAREMDKSKAVFTIFVYARCNPRYWQLTSTGGFLLRPDVLPADAILDIYRNSSLYAFECATAIPIIYYHAILNSIGSNLFNSFFRNLYLYSWHTDTDLGSLPFILIIFYLEMYCTLIILTLIEKHHGSEVLMLFSLMMEDCLHMDLI